MMGGSVFPDADGRREGCVEVLDSPKNLFLTGTGFQDTCLLAPVNLGKELAKVERRKFLKTGPAKLQFPDDPAENLPKFPHGADAYRKNRPGQGMLLHPLR